MAGRYYEFKDQFDCEGATKIFEQLSTTTEAACGELCFNAHADFFSLSSTGGSEYCYCW
jgi:hypothetical protein